MTAQITDPFFCESDSYIVRSNDGEDIDKIEITQDENGIDTEDRIIKLKKYIQEHPSM